MLCLQEPTAQVSAQDAPPSSASEAAQLSQQTRESAPAASSEQGAQQQPQGAPAGVPQGNVSPVVASSGPVTSIQAAAPQEQRNLPAPGGRRDTSSPGPHSQPGTSGRQQPPANPPQQQQQQQAPPRWSAIAAQGGPDWAGQPGSASSSSSRPADARPSRKASPLGGANSQAPQQVNPSRVRKPSSNAECCFMQRTWWATREGTLASDV